MLPWSLHNSAFSIFCAFIRRSGPLPLPGLSWKARFSRLRPRSCHSTSTSACEHFSKFSTHLPKKKHLKEHLKVNKHLNPQRHFLLLAAWTSKKDVHGYVGNAGRTQLVQARRKNVSSERCATLAPCHEWHFIQRISASQIITSGKHASFGPAKRSKSSCPQSLPPRVLGPLKVFKGL